MIDMHSKYDNMHTYGILNVLIWINKYVNSCINYMLSESTKNEGIFQGVLQNLIKLDDKLM